LQVPRLEKRIGIEVYATGSAGIGGTLRENAEDFIVQEILVDGSMAPDRAPQNRVGPHALDYSAVKRHQLLCIMVKRNWDTLIAVKNVANHLHIASSRIHIAGIKDAKAVTAQYITIEDASPEHIGKIHIKDIEIRPLGYIRNRLSAYYLLGNSFRIHIKSVDLTETAIDMRIRKIVDELEKLGGAPNFFGHQRFGTTRPITHLVGKAIIKKNFRKAAMLFLAKPSPYEHPSSRRARRELLTTLSFEQALKDFPKQLRYERSMLRHLVKHPQDFAGALGVLPSKLQEMFIQAYESYLFNRFLSGRIALELPLDRVEVGDYVVALERSGLAMPTVYKKVNLENREEIDGSLRAGKTRLAIPLVGFKQQISQGFQGEIERQVLEEEDVSSEDFRIPTIPEISARGRLRTATSPVNNFSLGEIARNADKPGRHDVKASFTLYRGSYATTFLREIMKPRSIIRQGF
jgi:tRNA pseudouridine13 synthase